MTIRQVMNNEAARLAVDCLYSEKQQYISAASWRPLRYMLGIPATVLAILAGSTALSEAKDLVAVFSLGAAFCSGLMTFLDPAQNSASHQNAGVAYGALKRRLRQFIHIDLTSGASDDELRAKLETLTAEVCDLQKTALPPVRSAYAKAKKALQVGEASYTVEEVRIAIGGSDVP